MKRTKIVDALKSVDFNHDILVKGWVRSHRNSKAVDFIALNDGSTINNIQIVVDPTSMDAEELKSITTGACIGVTGTLVQSQGAGQSVEIQSKAIEIYGLCPSDYPMQKKGQTFEYMRQHAHLRLRTNTFGAVMRIRHNMAIAIHKYFHDHGFFYFHSPIITASDAEGAGEMFQVTTQKLNDLKKDEDGNIQETITYEYIPGVLMKLLVKALKNPNENYLLLIEEINRANVAAVFGDVFQLLDRDGKGQSEYVIATSRELQEYLKKEFDGYNLAENVKQNLGDNYSRLYLPSNIYI